MSELSTAALKALLDIRLDRDGLADVLDRVVGITCEALPGADDVSITLVRGEQAFSAAHFGELARAADELQHERGYGPCIDAALSGTVMRVTDMREESRWPDYAEAVLKHDLVSSLSIPLPVQTDVIGALNCYSRKVGGLDGDEAAASELAAHLAVTVANAYFHDTTARFADDMVTAMASRAVIEQAKGVIMAQNRCDAEAAFAVLRTASMGRNLKLRDLATMLVEQVTGVRPAPEA